MKVGEFVMELDEISQRNPELPVCTQHNINGVSKFWPIINVNSWMETVQLIVTTTNAPYCSVGNLHKVVSKLVAEREVDNHKEVVVSSIGKGRILRIVKDRIVLHPGLMVALDVYFPENENGDEDVKGKSD